MVGQRRGFFRIDGHRIAFATVGEGPLLVLPAWSVSNLVEDLKGERFRRFMNSLTSGKQVIRYDRVGSGLSDRRRPRERLSLDFEAANARHILDHAFDARRKGKPRILHIPRYEAAANCRASLRGIPTKPGLDRDEYPPAMSDEGGRADVRYVLSTENQSAGSVHAAPATVSKSRFGPRSGGGSPSF